MHLHMIWFRHGLECVPYVPWLPATFSAMPFPSALRRWLVQPITRGWLATIPTVFCHPVFQCLKTSADLLEDVMEKRDHSFLALIICFPYFFVRRQTQRFHFLIVHDFYAFGNPAVFMPEQSQRGSYTFLLRNISATRATIAINTTTPAIP